MRKKLANKMIETREGVKIYELCFKKRFGRNIVNYLKVPESWSFEEGTKLCKKLLEGDPIISSSGKTVQCKFIHGDIEVMNMLY